MGVGEGQANRAIIWLRPTLVPSICGSSSPIKRWVRYGLANPRIATVLVIPTHNAPFRSRAHWLSVSQPRKRKATRKSEYRFVFYHHFIRQYSCSHQSPAFLDSGLDDGADQCSTADGVNPSTGKAASHVSGYCFHALVRCYIIPSVMRQQVIVTIPRYYCR